MAGTSRYTAREKVKKGAQDAQRMLNDKVSMISDKVGHLISKEQEAIESAETRQRQAVPAK